MAVLDMLQRNNVRKVGLIARPPDGLIECLRRVRCPAGRSESGSRPSSRLQFTRLHRLPDLQRQLAEPGARAGQRRALRAAAPKAAPAPQPPKPEPEPPKPAPEPPKPPPEPPKPTARAAEARAESRASASDPGGDCAEGKAGARAQERAGRSRAQGKGAYRRRKEEDRGKAAGRSARAPGARGRCAEGTGPT